MTSRVGCDLGWNPGMGNYSRQLVTNAPNDCDCQIATHLNASGGDSPSSICQ